MAKVFVFTGNACCGKTTAMKLAQEELGVKCFVYSMIDPYKAMLMMYDLWDEDNKTPESRKLLCDLKSFFQKRCNLSIRMLNEYLRLVENVLVTYGFENEEPIALICSKEKNDVRLLKDLYGAQVIKIDDNGLRSISEQDASNYADASISEIEYDYLVLNTGSIEDLKNNIMKIIGD